MDQTLSLSFSPKKTNARNPLPDFLRSVEAREESDGPTDSDSLEEYGLVHDCSVFEGIGAYVEFVAGSTIQAAMLLNDDAFDIVLHWDGGR